MPKKKKRCPRQVGETFEVPLDAVIFNVPDGMRYEDSYDRESLESLATSMHAVGQIHPVNVWWDEERSSYRLHAGFRRLFARVVFGEKFGFDTIRVTLEREDTGDLRRLAENISRKDVTLYEKAQYAGELRRGVRGRNKHTTQQIAQAIGRTPRYVRMLLRFDKLPDFVLDAWLLHPKAFTVRLLEELVALEDRGELSEMRATVEAIVRRNQASAPAPAEVSPMTASLDASQMLLAPSGPATTKKRRCRGALNKRRILRHADRLGRLGEHALAGDDRAALVHTLLVAIANREEDKIEAIVTGLRQDLGAFNEDDDLGEVLSPEMTPEMLSTIDWDRLGASPSGSAVDASGPPTATDGEPHQARIEDAGGEELLEGPAPGSDGADAAPPPTDLKWSASDAAEAASSDAAPSYRPPSPAAFAQGYAKDEAAVARGGAPPPARAA